LEKVGGKAEQAPAYLGLGGLFGKGKETDEVSTQGEKKRLCTRVLRKKQSFAILPVFENRAHQRASRYTHRKEILGANAPEQSGRDRKKKNGVGKKRE